MESNFEVLKLMGLAGSVYNSPLDQALEYLDYLIRKVGFMQKIFNSLPVDLDLSSGSR